MNKTSLLLSFFLGFSLLSTAQSTSDLSSDCNSKILINSDVLKLVKQHITRVGEEEVPILVVDHHGDSTFCYISSFNSANTIAKNPPTGIYAIENKELLVYDKEEHSSFIKGVCLTKLVKKYRAVLYVDKLNTMKGLPDGTVQYFAYDPIWVKISLYNNKAIDVTESGIHHIPLIDYSF